MPVVTPAFALQLDLEKYLLSWNSRILNAHHIRCSNIPDVPDTANADSGHTQTGLHCTLHLSHGLEALVLGHQYGTGTPISPTAPLSPVLETVASPTELTGFASAPVAHPLQPLESPAAPHGPDEVAETLHDASSRLDSSASVHAVANWSWIVESASVLYNSNNSVDFSALSDFSANQNVCASAESGAQTSSFYPSLTSSPKKTADLCVSHNGTGSSTELPGQMEVDGSGGIILKQPIE